MNSNRKHTIYSEMKLNKDNITELLEEVSIIMNDSKQFNHGSAVYKQLRNEMMHLINLQNAFDQSVIVGITDISGKIVYVNDWFCKISQYTKEELLGNTHRLLKSDYHSKEFFVDMWKTISSGQKWEGEVKNKAKDGSNYWVQTSIIPINDENGVPELYISIRTDITKGKEAQEQLLQTVQEEYRETVQSLDEMIFKLKMDKEHRYYFTLGAGKLAEKLGLTTEFIKEKQLAEVFPEKDCVELIKNVKKAFKGEHANCRKFIHNRTLHISLSPIIKNGEIVEVVGNCSDISQLDRAQKTINYMAYHDSITELPNQQMFEIDIEEVKQSLPNHLNMGILCIKINGFTKINESMGHFIREKLLKQLSQHLIGTAKKFDSSLYRQEGSLFLVLVPNLKNMKQLKSIALEFKREIEKIHRVNDHEFKLTCNIGACSYPECGDKSEELLKKAFIALNYSRFKEFSAYKYYSDSVHKDYMDSIVLEEKLKAAIDEKKLKLYYQPKFDIQTDKFIGMEALVRWITPEDGFISPAKFIPLAEETGLIFSLGETVLRIACEQNKEWLDKGYDPLTVAVNVSPLELQHSQFIPKLKEVLEETGLPPQYLEIEITENSIMQDTVHSVELIKDLRELGVSVAIDDFGTGYSSLGYLKKFPVNTLKIDQTFIQDSLTSLPDRMLVEAMINIAHTFNLSVVAEGVETKEVVDFLKEIECEQVQGFYYSKPLPASEFEVKYLNK